MPVASQTEPEPGQSDYNLAPPPFMMIPPAIHPPVSSRVHSSGAAIVSSSSEPSGSSVPPPSSVTSAAPVFPPPYPPPNAPPPLASGSQLPPPNLASVPWPYLLLQQQAAALPATKPVKKSRPPTQSIASGSRIIPTIHVNELHEAWSNRPGKIPSKGSIAAWAHARNVNQGRVIGWFRWKRTHAQKMGQAVGGENDEGYDLTLATPPPPNPPLIPRTDQSYMDDGGSVDERVIVGGFAASSAGPSRVPSPFDTVLNSGTRHSTEEPPRPVYGYESISWEEFRRSRSADTSGMPTKTDNENAPPGSPHDQSVWILGQKVYTAVKAHGILNNHNNPETPVDNAISKCTLTCSTWALGAEQSIPEGKTFGKLRACAWEDIELGPSHGSLIWGTSRSYLSVRRDEQTHIDSFKFPVQLQSLSVITACDEKRRKREAEIPPPLSPSSPNANQGTGRKLSTRSSGRGSRKPQPTTLSDISISPTQASSFSSTLQPTWSSSTLVDTESQSGSFAELQKNLPPVPQRPMPYSLVSILNAPSAAKEPLSTEEQLPPNPYLIPNPLAKSATQGKMAFLSAATSRTESPVVLVSSLVSTSLLKPPPRPYSPLTSAHKRELETAWLARPGATPSASSINTWSDLRGANPTKVKRWFGLKKNWVLRGGGKLPEGEYDLNVAVLGHGVAMQKADLTVEANAEEDELDDIEESMDIELSEGPSSFPASPQKPTLKVQMSQTRRLEVIPSRIRTSTALHPPSTATQMSWESITPIFSPMATTPIPS